MLVRGRYLAKTDWSEACTKYNPLPESEVVLRPAHVDLGSLGSAGTGAIVVYNLSADASYRWEGPSMKNQNLNWVINGKPQENPR
jgi:hypothetical protein